MMLPMIRIRTAAFADGPELMEICNQEILHGTATFETVPMTPDQCRQWMERHTLPLHPLFVAEKNGRVAGYVSLSAFNEKTAYAGTAELSLYVAKTGQGKGTGTELMNYILDYARHCSGLHLIVSLITGGNLASVRLHQKAGFSYMGTLREAGVKFGTMLDVDFYQLLL